MRLYGKRYSKQFIDRSIKKSSETRDAILWDFDWNNNLARVKVQGSNEYIYAHFPQNWMKQPYWAKPGNAVRILHRQGIRGSVEIIGEGKSIPTPMEGSVYPPSVSLADAILSGLDMNAAITPNMGVVITTGTYRINDIEYGFTPDDAGYIVMDDPAPMIMGDANLMGVGEVSVAFDVSPTVDGEFRYDLVAIGTDETLDYITGEASITPVKPDIPLDHLKVGYYVLVQFDVTEITNYDIGRTWISNVPTTLEYSLASIAGSGTVSGEKYFQWVASGEAGYPTPEVKVRVQVKDQYGLALTPGAGSYTMTLDLTGTGHVHSSDTGYNSSQVSQNFSDSYYDFKYRRDESVTEESPWFKATLDLSKDLEKTDYLLLLDSGGNPIAF